MVRKRRDRQEIMFTALREIERGSKLRTRIMYASNISWKTINLVLNTLLSNGFVTEERRETDKRIKRAYYITEDGEKALEAYFDSRPIMGYETDQKWVRNIQEARWALNLLDLEQSKESCMILGTLLRTTKPFTINSLCKRLNLVRRKINKLMDRLKEKTIVTEHKVLLPENWNRLGVKARKTRRREMGLGPGWRTANYLVFDQDRFEELIYKAVGDRLTRLLG